MLTRTISILVLLMMLWVQTPVNQLMKLSILVEHYFEHKDKNNEISVIDFLKMHYAKGDVKDADHDRDMQLPFKHFSPTSLIFIFFQSPVFSITEKIFSTSAMKQTRLYQSPHHSSESLSNIWQPPRA